MLLCFKQRATYIPMRYAEISNINEKKPYDIRVVYTCIDGQWLECVADVCTLHWQNEKVHGNYWTFLLMVENDEG